MIAKTSESAQEETEKRISLERAVASLNERMEQTTGREKALMAESQGKISALEVCNIHLTFLFRPLVQCI